MLIPLEHWTKALPTSCRIHSCKVRPLCHGGCLKDRFIKSKEGDAGHNYLCDGLYPFFTQLHANTADIQSLSFPGTGIPTRLGHSHDARAKLAGSRKLGATAVIRATLNFFPHQRNQGIFRAT